ncbi:hypothetical protein BDV12DRAFT_203555 [Aspergillus spectabilis]
MATIFSLENGRPLAEAKEESNYVAAFVSWFAEEATRSYGDTIPSSYKDTDVLTFKEPVGCANRIFIHASLKDHYIAKLVEKVQALKLGRDLDSDTTQGPLVNAAAATKATEHVEDAMSKGAILHTGGKPPSSLQGFF